MKVITFKQTGDFGKLDNFLEKMKRITNNSILDNYGKLGVQALKDATPVDTGLTANSWSYGIVKRNNGLALEFYNSNIQNGCPIAIILQYGHVNGNGCWVEGKDYINPALEPIFNELAEQMWREVKR